MSVSFLCSKESLSFACIVFFLFWATLFPTFHSLLGSSGVALVNFPLILFSVGIIFLRWRDLQRYLSRSLEAEGILLMLVTYVVLFPISVAVGVIFSDVDLSARDYIDFHKPVMFVVTFLSLFILVSTIRNYDRVEQALVLIYLIVIVLGWLQFFKVPFPLLDLYTKEANLRSGRSSAPFVNPYDFGLFVSFFAYWFFLRALKGSLISLILFCSAIVSVLMTQSRSALIALVLMLFLVLPFLYVLVERGRIFRAKIAKPLFFLLLLLSLIFLVVLALVGFVQHNFPYMFEGIQMLYEGRKINSLSIRQEQLETALEYASAQPVVALFGNGPAKNVLEFVESIYTYFIFRFGFLGLVFVFFGVLFAGLLAAFKKVEQGDRALIMASLIWLLSILVVSAGNNFTEQVRISTFYYFILAVVCRPKTIG